MLQHEYHGLYASVNQYQKRFQHLPKGSHNIHKWLNVQGLKVKVQGDKVTRRTAPFSHGYVARRIRNGNVFADGRILAAVTSRPPRTRADDGKVGGLTGE